MPSSHIYMYIYIQFTHNQVGIMQRDKREEGYQSSRAKLLWTKAMMSDFIEQTSRQRGDKVRKFIKGKKGMEIKGRRRGVCQVLSLQPAVGQH